MPDFSLPDDVLALRDEIRAFVPQLRQVAASLEWNADARDRVPWDLVAEGSRRGWRTMGLPVSTGGGGASVLKLCVMIEELAAGDMGYSVIIDQTIKVQRILARLAQDRARAHFLEGFLADERAVLAICFTEPDVGSDYLVPYPDFRFRTTARQRPDGSWVLNGRKRFISNGADASYLVVFACTDETKPAAHGTSAFLVEPSMEGFVVEKRHEKIAQRTINNGQMRFDDVVLEPWRLIGEAHTGYTGARDVLRESTVEAAATTLGSAQAAYEMALSHTATRIQGGVPLNEHGNVRVRLGRMYAELEAARSLVYRAAVAVEHDPNYDFRLGAAAKLVAADIAVSVCESAVELHGGLGIMIEEAGVEKCLRDCISFLHSDGAQDSMALRIADLTTAMAAGH